MNLSMAKRIVSCGECWNTWKPLIPCILLGLMTCLLPIGLGLYLSGVSRTSGQALIIIGSVACGLFLVTCCLMCCSAVQKEAQQTVAAAHPRLTIRTPRVHEEPSSDTVVEVKPV